MNGEKKKKRKLQAIQVNATKTLSSRGQFRVITYARFKPIVFCFCFEKPLAAIAIATGYIQIVSQLTTSWLFQQR